MANKNETPPAAAPAAAAQTPAPAPAPAAAPEAAPSKIAALMPVIMVVILAPVVSWAVAHFILLPSMETRLIAAVGHATPADGAAAHEESAAPASESAGGEHGGKEKGGASGPSNTYEFTNMVTNLAGTMGTRYLKVTFLVTGKDPNLRDLFNKEKPKVVDITLNVLSSLTLADLEEAGAKNIIREKLVNAYNQAFGKKVVEQIYFSEFVVQ